MPCFVLAPVAATALEQKTADSTPAPSLWVHTHQDTSTSQPVLELRWTLSISPSTARLHIATRRPRADRVQASPPAADGTPLLCTTTDSPQTCLQQQQQSSLQQLSPSFQHQAGQQPAGTQQSAASTNSFGKQRQQRGWTSKSSQRHQKQQQQQQHARHKVPFVPGLLLGDMFSPCNALGLFQQHPDLDEMLRTSVVTSLPAAAGAAAAEDEHADDSAASSSSHSYNSTSSSGAADPASVVPATAQQSRPFPSDFAQGVQNLQAARALQGTGSSKDAASSRQPQHAGVTTSPEARQPQAEASHMVDPVSKLQQDPALQLLLRTVTPVEGRRLFFVSPAAANTIREALVIDRHKTLQQEKAAQLVAAGPLARAVLVEQQSPAHSFAGWLSDLTSWLHPSTEKGPLSLLQSPSKGTGSSAASAAAAEAVQQGFASWEVWPRARRSMSAQTQQPAAKHAEHMPAEGTAAGSTSERSPAVSSTAVHLDDDRGSLIKGPMQVVPLLVQFLAKAAQMTGGALDLKALEERSAAEEAAHIKAGGKGLPASAELPTSFVGRVPLEAALALSAAASDKFRCVPTGTDARMAGEAIGRAAAMDVRAPNDKWVFKVEYDDSSEEPELQEDAAQNRANRQQQHQHARIPPRSSGSHFVDADEFDSDDIAPPMGLTPIFQVPGFTVGLKSPTGQWMHFTPTFLSLRQLHLFLAASKAVAGRVWSSKRTAGREAARRRLEAFALALSGLSSTGGAVGTSISKGGTAADDDDDEDGMGELPEAKALLAELGEGNQRNNAAAVLSSGGGLAPPTGIAGMLNTLAVGAISLAGHGLAALGDALDGLVLGSPWGLQAIGFPTEVAVKAGYLETTLEELTAANVARDAAWRSKQQPRKTARLDAPTIPVQAAAAGAGMKPVAGTAGSPKDVNTPPGPSTSAVGSEVQGAPAAAAARALGAESQETVEAAATSRMGTSRAGGPGTGAASAANVAGVGQPADNHAGSTLQVTQDSGDTNHASTRSATSAMDTKSSTTTAAHASAFKTEVSPLQQDDNSRVSESNASAAVAQPDAAHQTGHVGAKATETAAMAVPVAASADASKAPQHMQAGSSQAAATPGGEPDAILDDAVQAPASSLRALKQLQAHNAKHKAKSKAHNVTDSSTTQKSLTSKQGETTTDQQGIPLSEPESLTGVAVLLQALWAVLHDARKGDGQLSALLASSWASQARVSAASESELSLVLAVQLRATQIASLQSPGMRLAPTSITDPHKTDQQTAAGSKPATAVNVPDGNHKPSSSNASTLGGDEGKAGVRDVAAGKLTVSEAERSSGNITSALMALNLPAALGTAGQTHSFEVGLHIHMPKLRGEVQADAPDSLSSNKVCADLAECFYPKQPYQRALENLLCTAQLRH